MKWKDEKRKKIVDTYGTPCYVYSETDFIANIEKVRGLFKNCKICFAIKANPFIVTMVDRYVDRFEACSRGEYLILKDKHIDESKIVYSGINKTKKEISELYTNGFTGIISIESNQQWENVRAIYKDKNIRVLFRVSSGNQFGVSYDDLMRIIGEAKKLSTIKVLGIHYYSGTQKKNYEEIKSEIDGLKDIINKISSIGDFSIEEIEYGPGLYAEYFDEKEDMEYVKNVSDTILESLTPEKLVIELGRYLAYTCGKYYTSVVDIKNTGKNNYAVVDGGIHQVKYYGQMLGIKNPIINHFSNYDSKNEEKSYIICGSLCTVNDILIKKWQGDLNIGDVYEFCRVGAYSSTEACALFLSRELPAIILDKNEKVEMIRDHSLTYCINKGRENV